MLIDIWGEWGLAAWLFGWGIMWLAGQWLMDLDYDRKMRGDD